MNNDSIAKIKMLNGSQKCLVFGLVSLLSLIGVPFVIMAMATREDEPRVFFGFCFFISILSLAVFPFAVATMVMSVKVRGIEKRFWNAARPYRIWGAYCAMMGSVSSFIVAAFVAFLLLNYYLFGN